MATATGKWIEDVRPDQPISEVARIALAGRLESVWHYVPLAATSAAEDVEYVHQMRVWSRRAAAAVTTFGPLLPDRRREKMARWLKRIRRAAGPARDEDVLAARLTKLADGDTESGAAHLLAQVLAARAEAQAGLVAIHERLVARDFPHRCRQLVKRVCWREATAEPTYEAAARAALSEIVFDFQQAAEADLSDPVTLHQLRISGKRLRYAMEIFAAAYEPAFRETLYPQVEQLQELLGQVNDHAVAQRRFEVWAATTDDPRSQEALLTMIRQEQTALADSQRAFFKWWTVENHATLLHAFEPYL